MSYKNARKYIAVENKRYEDRKQAIIQTIRRANFALYTSMRSSKATACRCMISGLRYVMRKRR